MYLASPVPKMMHREYEISLLAGIRKEWTNTSHHSLFIKCKSKSDQKKYEMQMTVSKSLFKQVHFSGHFFHSMFTTFIPYHFQCIQKTHASIANTQFLINQTEDLNTVFYGGGMKAA